MNVLVKVMTPDGDVIGSDTMSLDLAAERFLTLTANAEPVILMRHTVLAGGMYEYDHGKTRLEIAPVQEGDNA